MDTYFLLNHAEVEQHRLLKLSVFLIYATIFVAIPFIFLELYNQGLSIRIIAPLFGFVFLLMTLPISIYDILNHFQHFYKPELQKFLVRIILMIPIYSISACFSLTFSVEWEKYLNSFRGLYEAYVIWSFTYFLMAFLGPSEEDLCVRLASKEQQGHLFPFKLFLRDWKMGYEILYYCKLGTLQYVVWKTFVVLLSFFIVLDFNLNPLRFSFWAVLITSCSQMLAIYSLVLFYFAAKEDLAPLKPFPKFACIKGVVFFSFWQQTGISILVHANIIKSSEFLSAEDYGGEIQDFIICMEMFLFAIAHHYYFSYTDFCTYGLDSSPSSRPSNTTSRRHALITTADVGDLVSDIRRFSNDIREGSVSKLRSIRTRSSDTVRSV